MAEVKKLAPMILKWEGGLSKDKNDSASSFMCPTPFKGVLYHTNKGVTYRTWVKYFGTNNDARFLNMSNDDFSVILKEYWNIWRADEISNQSIANILVDWVLGSGHVGIKKVQTILGVSADGVVGPKTILAINNANQKELFEKIFDSRKTFLHNIVINKPSQKVFINGWMNRLNDFKFQA